SKTLYRWYIHPVLCEITIQEFYDKIIKEQTTKKFSVKVDSSEIEFVEINKSQNAVATKANLNCNIIELINSFGINIHYYLKSNQTLPPSSFLNGLSIIMKNVQQDQLYLPVFSQPSKPNQKQILQQDIINWIKNNGSGWSSLSFANSNRKKFVDLMEVIWYIDMRCHDKFKEYELDSFVVSILGYISFFQQQKEISAINHNSEVLVQSVKDATSIKIHNRNTWIAPINKTKYYDLINILTNTLSWKPIDIEEYLPTDPMLRYIQELVYAFPFKIGECWLTLVAAQFLAGKAADAIVAVDERHYDTVVHLATAISVNDLLQQIKYECIPEIPCHCTLEEFELLKQLPDPFPSNDLHYKSFEELYGTITTEEHRPSLKNSKPITSKTAITTEQTNIQVINSDTTDNHSENGTSSNNTDKDNILELNDQDNNDYNDEQESCKSKESNYSNVDEEVNVEVPIKILFEKVFVNDLWTCALLIERPYYSAGIYPDICYNCGSAEDLKKTKGKLPLCSKCTGVTIPKKWAK
ncbi:44727_t:CDS:2, partial [Gigaspora margarita]